MNDRESFSDNGPLIAALAAITGHRFKNEALAARALTHASVRNNPQSPTGTGDYERLEFLGDRVLGLTVADMLYQTFPSAAEGEMSLRLNALVRTETLADLCDEIGLTPLIRTGVEMTPRAARKLRNLKADVMEALVATLYLDGGLEVARGFVVRVLKSRLEDKLETLRDAKTELQEWAYRVQNEPPRYAIIKRDGPDHAPVFTVEVRLKDGGKAEANGRSKREAEQSAAEYLLRERGIWKDDNERD